METYEIVYHAMGTVVRMQVTENDGVRILEHAKEKIEQYAKQFSANQEDSNLMRLNRAAGKDSIRVSESLFELITIGKKHSVPVDSFMNIAIGPLVKAWRIGFRDAQKPSEEDIKALLERSNPNDIILRAESNEVSLAKEQMEIDLGCIAKGLITDRIVSYFQDEGVQAGIVDLGGNVRVFGEKEEEYPSYRVGIANPFAQTRAPLFTVQLNDKAVVTSGVNERFFEEGGKKFHHLLDKRTGYPIETDVMSITIISDTAIDGEIWTTRLFGFTAEEAMRRIEKQAGIEGIIIRVDGMVAFSSGIKAKQNELYLL